MQSCAQRIAAGLAIRCGMASELALLHESGMESRKHRFVAMPVAIASPTVRVALVRNRHPRRVIPPASCAALCLSPDT